jgi:uncharacterized protein YqgV (UPF0045/DUF77 family)
MPKTKVVKVSLKPVTKDIEKAITEIAKAVKKVKNSKLKNKLDKTMVHLKKIDKMVRAECAPTRQNPPGGHMIIIPTE